MSAGYTPGPWHTGADGRIVYNAAGWAVCNAVTFHQRHQGDEDRANARLIAAAPELLEELEECASDLEAEIEARRGAVLERTMERDLATVARARAIIAKATGQ